MIYRIINGQIEPIPKEYVEYLYNDYLPDGTIIADGGGSPIDTEEYINNIKNLNIPDPYTIITGDYRYFKNPDPRVKFFPFWTIWASKPYSPAFELGHYGFETNPKKYAVSCLNGTYWTHRKLTYLLLSQREYFTDMIFSFGHRAYFEDHVSGFALTDEEQQAFNQLPQEVESIPSDKTAGIDISINHPAYTETYINLVTETSCRLPMLSEKTFKPIVAGQLFVLVASPGAVQFLRDIGIDTFDDIIDHGYDLVTNTRNRIKLALKQLDHLVTLDLATLYAEITPRLLKNSEYVRSQQFRDQFWLKKG